jgi:Flp pilus assembly pilin Flp
MKRSIRGAYTTEAHPRGPDEGQREALGRLVMRLVRDEAAVTTLEYVVAAVALALAAVAASRIIAGVLKNYLHRIYLVVTLPIP